MIIQRQMKLNQWRWVLRTGNVGPHRFATGEISSSAGRERLFTAGTPMNVDVLRDSAD